MVKEDLGGLPPWSGNDPLFPPLFVPDRRIPLCFSNSSALRLPSPRRASLVFSQASELLPCVDSFFMSPLLPSTPFIRFLRPKKLGRAFLGTMVWDLAGLGPLACGSGLTIAFLAFSFRHRNRFRFIRRVVELPRTRLCCVELFFPFSVFPIFFFLRMRSRSKPPSFFPPPPFNADDLVPSHSASNCKWVAKSFIPFQKKFPSTFVEPDSSEPAVLL